MLWEKILKEIKRQVSSANFKTWFSQTTLAQTNQQGLVIAVPSAFIKNQLAKRYQDLILETSQNILNQANLKIDYLVDPSLFSKEDTNPQEGEFNLTPFHHSTANPSLNPKYTLENFVVGLTNNLAYAAAKAIVQNPGSSYNPLFIYGPSGVGKTHLMHGIGHSLSRKNSTMKIIYASSERFMVDFVDSIQNKSTSRFRGKYRSCDLLLVDDIQFISGKDSTQEEFFHTFNEIFAKGAQVVLTSDRPPNEIQKLESRLSSRFQGGLMVDIQLPDFDTRVAILKAKLLERQESLPEEILTLIAESTESNTRELEGKLIQVLSTVALTHQPIEIETVKKLLGKTQPKGELNLDPKKTLSNINHFFNLRMADLIGPKRQKELVLPRQIAMFILYEDCKIPMERVGQLLGGRDHTTVLHGVEKIRQAIKRDREIQRLVIEVKQSLAN